MYVRNIGRIRSLKQGLTNDKDLTIEYPTVGRIAKVLKY